VAKTASSFSSDHTIRQYAYGWFAARKSSI